MDYKKYIENIPDFPIEGIQYKDIQPLLADSNVFMDAVKDMGRLVDYKNVKYWVGIESRGFLFASALALVYGGGVRIIRKKGKLPNNRLFSVSYGLEYGKDELEMAYIPQHDSGTCVLVDDVLATGGTIQAAENLCKLHGLEVTDKLCLLDIGLYDGYDVKSLIKYE
ncbi:adenine phosphoribosyltransferase [archaeon]|nr:adenine phosphoribosyltransferase [archaeon]